MLKENFIKSTIPNGLTLFRCLTALLLPLIVIYGGEIGAIVATPLLILAGMTDYFDGFFARKYKVISNFGKILKGLRHLSKKCKKFVVCHGPPGCLPEEKV